MKLARKTIEHKSSALYLFNGIAKMFKEDVIEDMVWTTICEVYEKGCDVKVEYLKDAITQCAPFPNTNKDLIRPIIVFDHKFSLGERNGGSRQLFLHFIKILHEFTHILTPYFHRWSEGSLTLKETPTKIGTVYVKNGLDMGDCGSGFEEHVLGGRLIPNLLNRENKNYPYLNPLRLIKRKFKMVSPIRGNNAEYEVSDAYINRMISSLQAWDPASNEPFPSLTISNNDLNLVRGGFVENIEDLAPKKRKSKKSKTNEVKSSSYDYDQEGDDDDDDDDMGDLIVAGVVYDEEHVRTLMSGFKY